MSEPIFCHDVFPGPEPCCDSCHEDQDYGFDMWLEDWLNLCCYQMRNLEDAGIDRRDEAAVRAYAAAASARTPVTPRLPS